MKLRASIGDNHEDVEIRREADRVFANIGERQYELDVRCSPSGFTFLTSDGEVFDCRVESQPLSGRALDVFVRTNLYAVTIDDPKRLSVTASAGAHADGAARIIAPMPGKVVRVLVEAGTQVELGNGIIVVEAMKMQNEMKSPKAGVVTALNVEVGATVNGGDVLAVIE